MKKINTSALAVLACFFILFSSVNESKAQPTPVDPQIAAQLQAKLDELITIFNLKGLSASVIIPGQGTWNGVSGISHASVPIDTAMVFATGSITKNFTSAGILLLQQEGLLNLSDSLHEFLPPYPNIDSTITIQQLLQHTSGIFNYFDDPDWFFAVSSYPGQAMTPQFVLNNYVNTPVFAPGTSHQYCNTGFLLLGLIIEEVTGQSYPSFIRQRFLDPLQLTSFYVAEHEPATGVMPHNWSAQNPASPGTDMSAVPMTSIFGTSAADGALAGNAYDLARWGQLLFTGQVLNDTSQQLMTDFLPFNLGPMTGYGLGLMRYSSGNAQAWGHSGGIRGFSASLMFSPADSIVVSILSNKTSNANDLAWALLSVARQQLVSKAPEEASDLHEALVCFPNPANGNATVRYVLKQPEQVLLTLTNSLGQVIKVLHSGATLPGEHTLSLKTADLPAGIYFVRLVSGDHTFVQPWVITH